MWGAHETGAIVGGRNADAAGERASHRLRRTESGLPCDELHGLGETLQALTRGLDAQRLDIRSWSQPSLTSECAGEVSGAHGGAVGKSLDAEIVIQVVGDPCLKLSERPAGGGGAPQVRAELGLAPWPLEEHDQPPGNFAGHFRPEVILHQRQRQIDSRSDARGGPDAPVAYEDRPGIHLDLGMATGKLVAEGPVRGRAAAIEQPGSGQQEGTGAHRRHPPGPARGCPDPARQRLALKRFTRAKAPGHDQCVDRSAAAAGRLGGHDSVAARPGRKGDAIGRHDLDRVAAGGDLIGGGEHLGRARHVQRLETRVGEDHDSSRFYARHHPPGWRCLR